MKSIAEIHEAQMNHVFNAISKLPESEDPMKEKELTDEELAYMAHDLIEDQEYKYGERC